VFESRFKAYHERIPHNGWPCSVFYNHDQVRSYTRYGKGDDAEKRARVIAVLLMTMRGTPFLYYGEEIGMKNVRIPRSRIQDPVGKRYWPFNPGRDGERTPMQWNDGTHGGFSISEPWLPLADDVLEKNVERQLRDSTSLLRFYTELIALRKKHPALRSGDLAFMDMHPDVLAYCRRADGESAIIVLNFSASPKRIDKNILNASFSVLLSTHREKGAVIREMELIHPLEATVLVRRDAKSGDGGGDTYSKTIRS
jgi:alpha-glucosidase